MGRVATSAVPREPAWAPSPNGGESASQAAKCTAMAAAIAIANRLALALAPPAIS